MAVPVNHNCIHKYYLIFQLKSLGEKNSVSSYLLFIDDNEDIMTFSSDGYGPLESFLKNLPAMQIVNAEVAAYVKNENGK